MILLLVDQTLNLTLWTSEQSYLRTRLLEMETWRGKPRAGFKSSSCCPGTCHGSWSLHSHTESGPDAAVAQLPGPPLGISAHAGLSLRRQLWAAPRRSGVAGEGAARQPETTHLLRSLAAGGRHECRARLSSGEDARAPRGLTGRANRRHEEPGAPPVSFTPRFEVSLHRVFKQETQTFGCSHSMCNTGDGRAARDGEHLDARVRVAPVLSPVLHLLLRLLHSFRSPPPVSSRPPPSFPPLGLPISPQPTFALPTCNGARYPSQLSSSFPNERLSHPPGHAPSPSFSPFLHRLPFLSAVFSLTSFPLPSLIPQPTPSTSPPAATSVTMTTGLHDNYSPDSTASFHGRRLQCFLESTPCLLRSGGDSASLQCREATGTRLCHPPQSRGSTRKEWRLGEDRGEAERRPSPGLPLWVGQRRQRPVRRGLTKSGKWTAVSLLPSCGGRGRKELFPSGQERKKEAAASVTCAGTPCSGN